MGCEMSQKYELQLNHPEKSRREEKGQGKSCQEIKLYIYNQDLTKAYQQ